MYHYDVDVTGGFGMNQLIGQLCCHGRHEVSMLAEKRNVRVIGGSLRFQQLVPAHLAEREEFANLIEYLATLRLPAVATGSTPRATSRATPARSISWYARYACAHAAFVSRTTASYCSVLPSTKT